jgi:hypothetical protein
MDHGASLANPNRLAGRVVVLNVLKYPGAGRRRVSDAMV